MSVSGLTSTIPNKCVRINDISGQMKHEHSFSYYIHMTQWHQCHKASRRLTRFRHIHLFIYQSQSIFIANIKTNLISHAGHVHISPHYKALRTEYLPPGWNPQRSFSFTDDHNCTFILPVFTKHTDVQQDWKQQTQIVQNNHTFVVRTGILHKETHVASHRTRTNHSLVV